MARNAGSPKASSWDKVSAHKAKDTLAHRDVYESQQLDRSSIQKRKSRTSRTVAAIALGALAFAGVWVVWSLAVLGLGLVQGTIGDLGTSGPAYYERTKVSATRYCYQPIDQAGNPITELPCYKTEQEAKDNPPPWYVDREAERGDEQGSQSAEQQDGIVGHLLAFSLWKLIAAAAAGLAAFVILFSKLMRNLDSQNLMHDTSDINQYKGDQHIALPEEIQRKFDWFPDVGAHSNVQASSMISHVMITNKGLKKVPVARRAQTDILDDDGDIEYYQGEVICDDDDRVLTTTQPIVDEAFGDELFEASGLPGDKSLRKRYDTTRVPYNPDGSDRDKLGTYKTVADMINADWTFPEYEVQRPAGAYLVDTAPVNTMVLAITRAGKGQTYIEPMIDMWLREESPSNMVINDPKGELLVKNYVRATMRGFQVVQFNLINAMKTDIYNPLGMAADAAREGDATKCALYVENIADVFFPLTGGEDPVWPTAANNAFKRAAYGLIDFYLEEERELRAYAARTDMDPKVLETMLDEKWGKVSLYNCYQLFVQLTAKKSKNPVKLVEERAKRGEFGRLDSPHFREADYLAEREDAQRREFLWEGKPEADLLTLYFNATEALPRNTMRTLIVNANNALRSMAGADKMLASVYGIAITAMSFFTDPTISTLTSGTPSQNTDLGGLSFPRRMGVRFGMNYLKRDHLIGAQAKWDAYQDAGFEHSLGEDFEHEDIVSREGWARYYFQGKFPTDIAYLRLRLIDPQKGMLIRTLFFRFTKDYQTSLNGRHYITDPVTGKKIVRNGVLVELKPNKQKDGSTRYEPGKTMYPQARLTNLSSATPTREMGEARAIIQTMVRYSDAPKAIFLVTPPHLMKYAKLILILIKQLVDLNFDKSYMTKSNQKPLYKTRFMLDELGNLQSDGHGISGFETMLSIGLGQGQEFTLILQTLQQLRDVYGESVDKIVQGNTSNIVFLKSTDDSMIETLEKMSGKRHVSYVDSKTVTKDTEKLIKAANTEGKVSYTMSTKEEPVISYNDMAFISERNSIVFRAGDSPVWNRNEMILPMSWRMFEDSIVHPGHEYSLQTIPTLSSALDFDVRMNQPDFEKMLAKRMQQAEDAVHCRNLYQEVYEYTDADVTRLDPDVYSEEVMELVDEALRERIAKEQGLHHTDDVDVDLMDKAIRYEDDWEANLLVKQEVAQREAKRAQMEEMVFAGGQISRSMLINPDGSAKRNTLDAELIEAYKAIRADFEVDGQFIVNRDGDLCSEDGSKVFIARIDESDAAQQINEASTDAESRVFAEEEVSQFGSFSVQPAFYEFLASLGTWRGIARGEFERVMTLVMSDK